jgi:hypothetical protein
MIRNTSGAVVAFAAVAAAFTAVRPTSVSAAPQAACSLLSVETVRAIVGSPVVVFEPGSSAPTVRGDTTFSTCTYTVPKRLAGSATFTLMWGPAATLAATYSFYTKRHQEQSRMKGDLLVLASVRNGKEIDTAASGKLLEAVVKDVR